MIKYREILRLHAQDLSNRGIASSYGCSKNNVGVVLKRAEKMSISLPLEKEMGDSEFQGILLPEKNKSESKRQPDVSYLHKELAKSGVTLSPFGTNIRRNAGINRKFPITTDNFVGIR